MGDAAVPADVRIHFSKYGGVKYIVVPLGIEGASEMVTWFPEQAVPPVAVPYNPDPYWPQVTIGMWPVIPAYHTLEPLGIDAADVVSVNTSPLAVQFCPVTVDPAPEVSVMLPEVIGVAIPTLPWMLVPQVIPCNAHKSCTFAIVIDDMVVEPEVVFPVKVIGVGAPEVTAVIAVLG